jgi:hypothetical protein
LARERTKAGITYCNTHNLEISVMGYGWCYDPMIKDVTEYLRTTEAYIAHCSKNNFPTRIIFTTGPVDGDSYTARGQGGNYGYSIYQRYETIRKHVAADPSRILFDYSDILSHDASGKQSRLTYNGRPYEVIAPSNLAGKTRGTHIGPEGDLRLAKAMWWLLARIAGWDGEEGGS